ncbi:MAG: DUF86 domain-containing protein [Phycisphaerae bacterium]|nr:DUF86 domain-containing protein [Phycisphaerae bacterium]
MSKVKADEEQRLKEEYTLGYAMIAFSGDKRVISPHTDKLVEAMSYDDFLADRKTQDAVIRNVEIIGEAARSLPADFTERHEDIPWSDIIGMRNILVHQYFGILPDVVWDVIKNELPTLRSQIAEL